MTKILARAGSAPAARSWYRISARNDADDAAAIEVSIYEEIGLWGVDAKQFIEDFKAIDDGASPVIVAINSPGGDVFDGFALNGWIQRLGARATARIDGLAASAASVIAVGAHQVVIGESAMMMIHNPWTFAYGDANDLRKTADMMDKTRDGILAAYRRKAPDIEDAELIRMLDEETWLSAGEAVALGLADSIVEQAGAKACRGASGLLARFKHPPQALLHQETGDGEQETDAEDAPKPEGTEPAPEAESTKDAPEPEPEQASANAVAGAVRIFNACVRAGIPNLAEEIIMTTKLDDDKAVAAEAERIKTIGELCALARLPELAVDYAKDKLSADDVRARLIDRIAANGGEIDNKEPESEPEKEAAAKAKSKLNPSAVYAARKSKAQTTKGV